MAPTPPDSFSLMCLWARCGVLLADESDALRHLERVHLEWQDATQENYRCRWAGCTTFISGKQGTQRIKAHWEKHITGKPFPCTTQGCPRSFSSAGWLARHINIDHGTATSTSSVAGKMRENSRGDGTDEDELQAALRAVLAEDGQAHLLDEPASDDDVADFDYGGATQQASGKRRRIGSPLPATTKPKKKKKRKVLDQIPVASTSKNVDVAENSDAEGDNVMPLALRLAHRSPPEPETSSASASVVAQTTMAFDAVVPISKPVQSLSEIRHLATERNLREAAASLDRLQQRLGLPPLPAIDLA